MSLQIFKFKMSLKVCLQHMLLVHIFFCFTQVTTANVSAIIVFGDSSVDTGNNNQLQTMAKSDFEPYGRDFIGGRPTGRFCNGRLATDFISEAFGLPPIIPAYLDPSFTIQDFSVGVSFASAASGYDNVTADVLSVISLSKQMEYFNIYRRKLTAFQGQTKATETLKNALYVLSLGTNDFLENYYTLGRRSGRQTVDQYEYFLVGIAENFIIELHRLGARKIDLTGLPPMGCLPLERAAYFFASSCNENYNNVAKQFNFKLENLVTKLNRQLPGLKLVYADVYTPLEKVVHDPSSYGFDNAERGCCATGLFEMGYICNRRNPFTCADASKYVFWDAFHPTERMNFIVSDHLMKSSLATFL